MRSREVKEEKVENVSKLEGASRGAEFGGAARWGLALGGRDELIVCGGWTSREEGYVRIQL